MVLLRKMKIDLIDHGGYFHIRWRGRRWNGHRKCDGLIMMSDGSICPVFKGRMFSLSALVKMTNGQIYLTAEIIGGLNIEWKDGTLEDAINEAYDGIDEWPFIPLLPIACLEIDGEEWV